MIALYTKTPLLLLIGLTNPAAAVEYALVFFFRYIEPPKNATYKAQASLTLKDGYARVNASSWKTNITQCFFAKLEGTQELNGSNVDFGQYRNGEALIENRKGCHDNSATVIWGISKALREPPDSALDIRVAEDFQACAEVLDGVECLIPPYDYVAVLAWAISVSIAAVLFMVLLTYGNEIEACCCPGQAGGVGPGAALLQYAHLPIAQDDHRDDDSDDAAEHSEDDSDDERPHREAPRR